MANPGNDAPKILAFDIETSPRQVFVWGHWEQNVLSVVKEWYMLSFAYRWMGNGGVKAYSLPDFKSSYKRDPSDDRDLCAQLHRLMGEADVVLAHNGAAFDIKKANSRFVFHGFPPPAPFQDIDTLKIARRYFEFPSNKLDDLGDYLKVGRKLQTGGKDLWLDVMRGDKAAWAKMVAYNKGDVGLLIAVYDKLKAWTTNHPNANLYKNTLGNCPVCGKDTMIRQGHRFTRTGKQQRFQCQSCGSWASAPDAETAVIR